MTVRRSWQSARRSRRFRVGLVAAGTALITGAIVAALTYSGSTPNVPLLNLPVPAFTLHSLIPGGSAVTAAELRRGRPVVLNFWGSWCPPCTEEMPALQAIHRELGDKVRFVGIDEEDTRPAALAFLHRVGVTYPSGFDGDGAVAQQAFHIDATPTTYFIAGGKMLDFHQGRLTEHALRTDVRTIFGIS
jgi:cytochrome c biogenesis protein CcmG, thiol:disulfide interchange protein DsbE